MLNRTTLTVLVAVLAVGSAVAGQPAFAEQVSVKVHYHPADLSTEAGAKSMLRKIQTAAQQACGDEEYWSYRDSGYSKCVRESTDRAVAQLSSPMVTALNGGRGASAPTALASAR
jgi:UrcA family protein